MPVRQFANAPATSLSAACTNIATTITVASVTGYPITFPYVLILDRGTASEEAVEVTGAAGTTLTVVRGIDGTTAFAHNSGASVVHGITARDAREANTHANATGAVHGLTGSIVGTTDTQTLTNKTLTSPVIDGTPTGVGVPALVKKVATETIGPGHPAALQNDDALFFAYEANGLYRIQVNFIYTCTASTGFNIGLITSTAVGEFTFMHAILNGTVQGATALMNGAMRVSDVASTSSVGSAYGYFRCATAGTATFKWGPKDYIPSDSLSVLAGSHLIFTRIA